MPNGWEQQKLGTFSELQRGFDLPSKKRVDGGIPIISSSGLSGYHNEFKVKAPGVVTGRYGSIGEVFFVEENFWPLNTSLWVKDFHGNDPKFVYYLLSNFDFKKFSDKTGVPGVNRNDLHAVKVLSPPLSEQKRISKILSTWDKAINTTERLIDNSKQQKKALMQQLLTGAHTQRKRLLDDSGKPFEGEWEEVKLGELGTTFTSLTGKTKSDFGSGKLYVPYINIFKNASVDINHLERVNISENERQNEVKFGDIFFTTSSETPEEVGMSSVMLDMPNEAVYLNSFCFGFRLHSFEQATPIFMKHVLRSSSVRRFISILAQGATRYNLSKTQLLKVKISLPKKEEQQKIASVLNNADKEIELLEQQLADLKQEKKALMQQLLTGKKRVLI
ncbi:MAG: restriction endonuclease subunit S [Pseudoalteromonas sp.]|nr:restriction endonuclease subunit S [Pseudoalteromonas sp.]